MNFSRAGAAKTTISNCCPLLNRVGMESWAAPIDEPNWRSIGCPVCSSYSGAKRFNAAAKAPEVITLMGVDIGLFEKD